MEVFGLLFALLARDEVVHHARTERPRPVERHQCDDVLESIALEAFFQILCRTRLGLEHGRGVAVGKELVYLRIVEPQILEPEIRPVRMAAHKTHGFVQNGERTQAEEIELDQTDGLDIVLVVLRDCGIRTFRTIQRAEVGQPPGRNQHAAGVHAHIARQFLQLAGQSEEFAHFLFLVVARLQLRLHLQRLFQRHRLHAFDRHQLGELVAISVGHVEHTADVADHRLGTQCAEGGDLRNGVVPILVLDVQDHLLAFVLAEIHVEVGHRHPLRIEEALEQQIVGKRIEVGNPQRVSHQRTGTGAAPRPDRHVVVLGPVDEVRHDQEVARKTHLNDGAQFEFEPFDVLRPLRLACVRVGIELSQAFVESLVRSLANVIVQAHAGRRGEVRQAVLAQGEFEVAAFGDFDAVLQRLRQVGE